MTVVTGNDGLLVSGPSQDDEGTIRISLLGSPNIVNYFSFSCGVGVSFTAARVQAVVTNAEMRIKRSSEIRLPAASMTAWTNLESCQYERRCSSTLMTYCWLVMMTLSVGIKRSRFSSTVSRSQFVKHEAVVSVNPRNLMVHCRSRQRSHHLEGNPLTRTSKETTVIRDTSTREVTQIRTRIERCDCAWNTACRSRTS